MIKRVVLALVSLAAGALMLAAPASFGAAAQASASTGAAATTDWAPKHVDWGPNKDGWHVHVINDTRYTAEVVREPCCDNVFHAPKLILPGTTARDIRGRASIFGGPANMDIRYKLLGTKDRSGHLVSVILFIRSDRNGKVTAICSAEQPPPFPATGYHCAKAAAVVSNKPIAVRWYTSARDR